MAQFEIPSPFEWDLSFDVKNDELNSQHKAIFSLVNKLDQKRTQESLNNLLNYFGIHFACEEKLISQYNHLEGIRHRAEHEKFESQLRNIQTINDEAIGFLKQCLVNHIKGCDKQYAGLLWDRS